MIITCPNCNKQFKIDNSLIPDEGRDLQCGSCNHIWFYKIEEQNNELLKLNDEIVNKDIEVTAKKNEEKIEEKKQPLEKIKYEVNNKLKEKISEKQKNKTTSKNTDNKGRKFFSYLIVFIISFIALIILLDTLKSPLINVFPGLEIILFNLFETLQDIKLFIIDLI
tara:strand:- start:193 stop:690 length:498 start_codon:yes stop_codon:yes gene_type:complete